MTPLLSLSAFFCLTLLGYLFFRPRRGYYWKFRQGMIYGEKILREDILKMLYHSEYKNEPISPEEFQKLLNIDILEFELSALHLEENNLILDHGNKLVLTNEGRDYALKVIRAHRLYEKYLSEKTGYDKLQWHDMAEDMEHKLSFDELDQLSSQLGSPLFDPHGDPIPSESGEMIVGRGVPLYDLPKKTFGKIIHIEDKPEVVYKQILDEGLHIGSQVKIIDSNKLHVKFYCEGKKYVLANEIAANLTVIALNTEERIDEKIIRLSMLKDDETGLVEGISKECRGENRRRLLDLGFVSGTHVSVGLVSPMQDPRAYRLRSTDIALRNEQSNFILIKKKD